MSKMACNCKYVYCFAALIEYYFHLYPVVLLCANGWFVKRFKRVGFIRN